MLQGYDVPSEEPVSSRRKRSVCGLPYKFSRAQKEEALRVHNKLRAREGASNMMHMVSVSLSSLNVNDLTKLDTNATKAIAPGRLVHKPVTRRV